MMKWPSISNLTEYLDDRGSIATTGIRSRRFAEFLTRIVTTVTMAYGLDLPLGPIPCRRRHCRGRLLVRFDEKEVLYWYCPNCRDIGGVSNWRNTLWDLLEIPGEQSGFLSHTTH
jgi:hypothetical protein